MILKVEDYFSMQYYMRNCFLKLKQKQPKNYTYEENFYACRECYVPYARI